MPEGDTIHYAANRIRPVLAGHVPQQIATPHPRFGRDRWPERLAGRAVTSVDAHGKHLFLRFEGGYTIHSHLRMTGSWRVIARGQTWPRSARSAWLVIGRGEHEVLQFSGPVLELLDDEELRAVLVQIAVYCGIPVGVDCFRTAKQVLAQEKSS